MIVSCNACHNRYLIEEALITPEGRSVRCAACGHSWTQFPQVMDIKLAFPEDESSIKSHKKTKNFLSLLLTLLILAGLAAGIFSMRHIIINQWPAAAKIFGFVKNDPDQGLIFENVLPLQTKEKNQLFLVLKGEIVNTAKDVRHLGPLTVLIHGDCHTLGFFEKTMAQLLGKITSNRCVVDKWQHVLNQNRLLPGEKLGFETVPHLLIQLL